MKIRKFENIGITHALTMTIRTSVIIHIFALLHFAVSYACRLAGIGDEILLTLLTVLMVSMLCVKMKAGMELTVSSIILTNVIGYFLGVYGARMIAVFSDSDMLPHSLSTLMTTEIIGWGTLLLLKAIGKALERHPGHTIGPPPPTARSADGISKKHIILLAVVIILIIFARAAITRLFSLRTAYSLSETVRFLLSNSGMAVVILCLLVLLVRHIRKSGWNTYMKSGIAAGTCILLSGIAVLIARLNLPSGPAYTFSLLEYLQLLTVSVMMILICFSLVYIADYAIGLNAAVRMERDKANLAEFQYARLKQQVNPHFLFNSLNILDCLVLDGNTAQASTYIHKLAGIYRYMLKYDDRTTVTVEDEMNFVGLYTDLLKVRFEDGFSVETDIPERIKGFNVIPCSVQMLIENAIKHNRLGKEDPLVITVNADDNGLSVSNPLRPKLSAAESTKVGLNYLKRQYMDLYGKEVEVVSDGSVFSVTVPLLHKSDSTIS